MKLLAESMLENEVTREARGAPDGEPVVSRRWSASNSPRA
jgi:hypothetical protein